MRNTLFRHRGNPKGFFEGWYYRQVSGDGKTSLSLIPKYSRSKEDPHAFLQYILDDHRGIRTGYIRYLYEALVCEEEPFSLSIGENRFHGGGFTVDLRDGDLGILGEVVFGPLSPIGRSLYAPGIMGPFSYLPFMECNHAVISMDHSIQGTLSLLGETVTFDGGQGYLEKDWGISFPDRYVWVQANRFTDGSTFFVSVASIPLGPLSFEGFIGVFFHKGVEHRFASYLPLTSCRVRLEEKQVVLSLKKRDLSLEVRIRLAEGGSLRSPRIGRMDEVIKEAPATSLEMLVRKKGAEEITLRADVAALEVVGEW